MSGRYDWWCQKSGDTAERPDLTDQGKKLLAYLDNQRRLSGVKTIEKTIRLEDGSIVSAGFDYDIPWIRVIAGGKKKQLRVVARTIEGFIVRPGPNSDNWENTDLDHVLLTPAGGSFNAAFYDETQRPAAYDSRPLYGEWLPDGLLRYGNVDWQNADASIVLSWMGPSGRYFGDAWRANGGPWVFLHGKVLFDFTADGATDAFGETAFVPDLGVRGACIRLEGRTSWLYVAARDEDFGEFLLRYRLQSPEMQVLMQGAGLDAPVHFFADVEVVYASGELLLAAETNRFNDGIHPFCFNADGTEARRMYEGDNTMWELRYVESDEGIWSRSEIEHGPLTSTEVEVGEREMGGAVGSWAKQYNAGWVTGSFPTFVGHVGNWADTEGHPWAAAGTALNSGFDPDGSGGLVPAAVVNVSDYSIVTASTLSYTRTPSQARVPFAVDWKNGEWVYAELYLIDEAKTSELTAIPSFSGDYKEVRPSSYDNGGGSVIVGDTDGHNNWAGSYSLAITETRQRTSKGLYTSFADIQCGVSMTGTISASASVTENASWDYATLGIGSAPDVTTEITNSRSFSQERETIESDYQAFFLDLRSDTLYYHRWTTTTTQTAEASDSDSDTHVTGDPPTTALALDLSFDRVTTTQVVWDTYLIVNGVELDRITQPDAAAVSTVPSSLSWNGSSGTGLGLIYKFTNTSGVEAAPSNDGFFLDSTFVTELGVFYSKPAAELTAWHRFRGATSGSDPTSYSDSATDPDNWFPPQQGALEETRDYFDDLTDSYGSWMVVRGDYAVSQQQPLNRNGEAQFAHFGSQDGLVPLLSAYPGAERLYPVGYLSRVIVARLLLPE